MMFGFRCQKDGCQPPESGNRFQKPRKSTYIPKIAASLADFLSYKIIFRKKPPTDLKMLMFKQY